MLVENDVPQLIIEVKLSDSNISPALHYFHKKYALKAAQIVKNINVECLVNGIPLRRAADFLKELNV